MQITQEMWIGLLSTPDSVITAYTHLRYFEYLVSKFADVSNSNNASIAHISHGINSEIAVGGHNS